MTLPNSSSINAYGSGILVDAVPLVDPTSEMPASALNNLRNDVSGMTATAPRAIFQFVGAASPIIASTATWTSGFDSVWGNAPAVQPTIANLNFGSYTVTFPSTVQDQLGNSILVNIRNAKVAINGSSVVGSAQCVISSASVLTIYCFNTSNSPAQLTGAQFFVEVY